MRLFRRKPRLPEATFGAKCAWTHTTGPTAHCPGSGKRGRVDSKGFVQCRHCRYAIQYGWGDIMREHEREAKA